MSDYLTSLPERAEVQLRTILELESDSAEAKQKRADSMKAFIESEDKIIREFHE